MKFFERIKLLAATIGNFIKNGIVEHLPQVLHTVDIIKAVVDNPAVDFLATLSGAAWEPALLLQIREALNTAVAVLGIADECNQQPTDIDKVLCLINHLRTLSPSLRSAVYAKLGSLMTLHLNNYALSETEADTFTQLAYANRKADNPTASQVATILKPVAPAASIPAPVLTATQGGAVQPTATQQASVAETAPTPAAPVVQVNIVTEAPAAAPTAAPTEVPSPAAAPADAASPAPVVAGPVAAPDTTTVEPAPSQATILAPTPAPVPATA